VKKIKLTKNKYVLVDAEDFDYLNQWKWCYDNNYAIRRQYLKGDKKEKRLYKTIYMHRLLNDTPLGYDTDHINRNKLDNRKNNLRTVTRSQNCHNRKIHKHNSSGYTGIRFFENKWIAEITVNYKKIYLGYFKNIDDAISARHQAERSYL